jgi:hypothetical protein
LVPFTARKIINNNKKIMILYCIAMLISILAPFLFV